jgi:hypothetical protein
MGRLTERKDDARLHWIRLSQLWAGRRDAHAPNRERECIGNIPQGHGACPE